MKQITPFIAVAAVTAAVAIAPQANAAQPSCGATITKDTTLTGDVTGCHGVGIRIGAGGITLDLNGHTVSSAAKRNPKAHGILNEGYDRLTVRGGTVSGFGAYGVRLSHADRNVVEDMRMTGNFTGVGLFESDRGVVRRNTMTGQRFVGVALTGGFGNLVKGNSIAGSTVAGVIIRSSPSETGKGHRIVGNRVSG
jgi:hypothetical protein